MKNLDQNGFSLIEIIFSIGIITVGLISILSLFSHNIKGGISNKNKLIAIYLAEEQLEVVRYIRDTNWKGDSVDWADGLCNTGNCLALDFVIITIADDYDFTEGWMVDGVNNIGQNWKKEVFNGADSYYNPKVDNETFGEKTEFNRWFTIEYCGGGTNCLEIISNVSHPTISDIQIKTRIYNWK